MIEAGPYLLPVLTEILDSLDIIKILEINMILKIILIHGNHSFT